jgi:hypothetical protein
MWRSGRGQEPDSRNKQRLRHITGLATLEQKVGLSPAESAFREQMGKDRRSSGPKPNIRVISHKVGGPRP